MGIPQKEDFKITHDAFHKGAYEVMQPAEQGYRSGLDAMLLAASLPPTISGTVADLGSGVGVAGLAALNLNSRLKLLMVEKNAMLVSLSEQSLKLDVNKPFKERATVLNADVMLSGNDRVKSGLLPDSVDHVIMNPPYNSVSERPPPDALRREAFMMAEGGTDAWFRTAAAIIKPGGTLVTIYRTQGLGDIIACMKGRFGGVEILPIYSRNRKPAKRIIVRATYASRAPLTLLPGFIVHEMDGTYTPQAQAIVNGTSHLEFL